MWFVCLRGANFKRAPVLEVNVGGMMGSVGASATGVPLTHGHGFIAVPSRPSLSQPPFAVHKKNQKSNLVRGFAELKKFQKSEINLKVGGYAQVSRKKYFENLPKIIFSDDWGIYVYGTKSC